MSREVEFGVDAVQLARRDEGKEVRGRGGVVVRAEEEPRATPDRDRPTARARSGYWSLGAARRRDSGAARLLLPNDISERGRGEAAHGLEPFVSSLRPREEVVEERTREKLSELVTPSQAEELPTAPGARRACIGVSAPRRGSFLRRWRPPVRRARATNSQLPSAESRRGRAPHRDRERRRCSERRLDEPLNPRNISQTALLVCFGWYSGRRCGPGRQARRRSAFCDRPPADHPSPASRLDVDARRVGREAEGVLLRLLRHRVDDASERVARVLGVRHITLSSPGSSRRPPAASPERRWNGIPNRYFWTPECARSTRARAAALEQLLRHRCRDDLEAGLPPVLTSTSSTTSPLARSVTTSFCTSHARRPDGSRHRDDSERRQLSSKPIRFCLPRARVGNLDAPSWKVLVAQIRRPERFWARSTAALGDRCPAEAPDSPAVSARLAGRSRRASASSPRTRSRAA